MRPSWQPRLRPAKAYDQKRIEERKQGGTVVVPPFDTPVGRIALLSDPQGAVFSVIKSAPA